MPVYSSDLVGNVQINTMIGELDDLENLDNLFDKPSPVSKPEN